MPIARSTIKNAHERRGRFFVRSGEQRDRCNGDDAAASRRCTAFPTILPREKRHRLPFVAVYFPSIHLSTVSICTAPASTYGARTGVVNQRQVSIRLLLASRVYSVKTVLEFIGKVRNARKIAPPIQRATKRASEFPHSLSRVYYGAVASVRDGSREKEIAFGS